ncbi:uncharacterized protein LOC132934823 [Metopolophium dirhodum]|uniref:uncharacterized protein LOC132934823 n=1 Tax=Metopolophium dirhodum TaxID=44670 RepID=UPI00298FCA62|nr:uncharacterized protein LOC132934823 [Metopolophium dirhodum]
MKIFKCGSCTFQLNVQGRFRFHVSYHTNKKEPEKPMNNQPVAKALHPVPQLMIQIYRCEVCSKFFDSRIYYLQKHLTQPKAPIKKFQIVLRKKLMKTMQMWKTKWETWTQTSNNSGNTQSKD